MELPKNPEDYCSQFRDILNSPWLQDLLEMPSHDRVVGDTLTPVRNGGDAELGSIAMTPKKKRARDDDHEDNVPSRGLGWDVMSHYYDSEEHKEFVYLLAKIDMDAKCIRYIVCKMFAPTMRCFQLLNNLVWCTWPKKFNKTACKPKILFLKAASIWLAKRGLFRMTMDQFQRIALSNSDGSDATLVKPMLLKLDSLPKFSGTDADWQNWKMRVTLILTLTGKFRVCINEAYKDLHEDEDLQVGCFLTLALADSAAMCVAFEANPGKGFDEFSAYALWQALLNRYETDSKLEASIENFKCMLKECKLGSNKDLADVQSFVNAFEYIVSKIRTLEKDRVKGTPWADTEINEIFVENIADKDRGNDAQKAYKAMLEAKLSDGSFNLQEACADIVQQDVRKAKHGGAKMKYNFKQISKNSMPVLQVNAVTNGGAGAGKGGAKSSKRQRKREKKVKFQLDSEDGASDKPAKRRHLPKEIYKKLCLEPAARKKYFADGVLPDALKRELDKMNANGSTKAGDASTSKPLAVSQVNPAPTTEQSGAADDGKGKDKSPKNAAPKSKRQRRRRKKAKSASGTGKVGTVTLPSDDEYAEGDASLDAWNL